MGQIGAFAQKKGVWLWALRKPKHEKKGGPKNGPPACPAGKAKTKTTRPYAVIQTRPPSRTPVLRPWPSALALCPRAGIGAGENAR
jgi:hypothetical protein